MKRIDHIIINQNKAGVALLIQQKVNFKTFRVF